MINHLRLRASLNAYDYSAKAFTQMVEEAIEARLWTYIGEPRTEDRIIHEIQVSQGEENNWESVASADILVSNLDYIISLSKYYRAKVDMMEYQDKFKGAERDDATQAELELDAKKEQRAFIDRMTETKEGF